MDSVYWKAEVISIGGEEGNITVFFLWEDKPSWKLGLNLLEIEKARLEHGPCCRGRISIKRTSDSQKIIFCAECGLRRRFPADIRALGSFKQFFEKIEKEAE